MSEASTQEPLDGELLKLSCWFGERERIGGRLLADVLLERFAAQRVQTSILLRGIEGFGLRHHLRTDRLLTLSEDLPAVAIALDSPRRIASMLPEVLEVKRRGLLTLERARTIASGDRVPGHVDRVPDHVDRAARHVDREHALKLTIHLPRHHRVNGKPAFVLATEILHRHRAAGATVLLGVDGTSYGVRHRAKLVGRNENVPMLVMSVGDREPIAAAIPEIERRLPHAVLTIERVLVCRRDGETIAALEDHPVEEGMWQKLTIVTSEAALHHRAPLHELLIRGLREAGAAGATALRGIWGFHGDHPPHGDKLLSLRRHVPVLTVLVDTPQRISKLMPIVTEVTSQRGLVTSELIPAMRSAAEEREIGSLELGLEG